MIAHVHVASVLEVKASEDTGLGASPAFTGKRTVFSDRLVKSGRRCTKSGFLLSLTIFVCDLEV